MKVAVNCRSGEEKAGERRQASESSIVTSLGYNFALIFRKKRLSFAY